MKPLSNFSLRALYLSLLLALACIFAPPTSAQDACGDPTPGVEATPAPDKHKKWSPGTEIGIEADNKGVAIEGAPRGGQIVAPQDQTQTPYDPEKVIVGPGEEVGAAVSDARDSDTWVYEYEVKEGEEPAPDPCGEDKGIGADEVTYKWSASGGEFTGGTESASTSWKAPREPGNYTLTCTINDLATLEAGDTGSRDDDAVTRSCTVIVPSISISFVQSQLAIGSKGDDGHKAKFKVTASDADGNPVPDIDIPTPEVVAGGLGPDEDVTASVEMDSNVTDSEGKATGKLTSGNRAEYTTIQIKTDPDDPDSGGPSASAEQVWNALGDEAWSYEPYFYYDESSDIEYRMAYNRDGGEVPITGHSMEPETTSIKGYEWDEEAGEDWDGDGYADGDYYPATYSKDDADSSGYDAWSGLVEWGGVSESDGTYTASQTIKYDEDFELDSVYFWLWDNDSFGEDGDDE